MSDSNKSDPRDTLVEFDPSITLSDTQKELILQWDVLQTKLEDRKNNGFNISRVVVKGASFVGGEDNPKLILLSTRLYYTDPAGKASSYHGVFMPDGAALLEVFRVTASETTKPDDKSTEETKYFAKMVTQDRVVANAQDCLEVPVGMLEEGETAADGARREHMEETGSAKKVQSEIIPLGSIVLHNAIAERQHLFLVVQDVSPEEFEKIQNELTRKGGVEAEGERTGVVLMPIKEAYYTASETGNSASTIIHLSRAMEKLKINYTSPWAASALKM